MNIDKGVPIPKDLVKSKYEYLNDMEVGDSVVISVDDYYRLKAHCYRVGVKITRRKHGDMVRVWRLS